VQLIAKRVGNAQKPSKLPDNPAVPTPLKQVVIQKGTIPTQSVWQQDFVGPRVHDQHAEPGL
jgi:hypothetical protein